MENFVKYLENEEIATKQKKSRGKSRQVSWRCIRSVSISGNCKKIEFILIKSVLLLKKVDSLKLNMLILHYFSWFYTNENANANKEYNTNLENIKNYIILTIFYFSIQIIKQGAKVITTLLINVYNSIIQLRIHARYWENFHKTFYYLQSLSYLCWRLGARLLHWPIHENELWECFFLFRTRSVWEKYGDRIGILNLGISNVCFDNDKFFVIVFSCKSKKQLPFWAFFRTIYINVTGYPLSAVPKVPEIL